ncbi:glycerol-3-phosphate 1-O-acyltransferase PlsY [Fluviicola sp.]|jgi:glycerol-3-phosphate acyltransferase PlsY|uniref:glycerol-3-phosphate 1-O-acyltransferase PlsY n=1 Tax=Fluviicola sp. TaxID=1917219 RepID=UPI00281DC668|nr:glycerol-3-phosphate 1-O-acyltransferase PlsY [Fluviicola sp.]MDR0803246.1 glycerol-3-phosphate 1-O-acyltransferase PlsY [Fluviicola sp.]
MMNWTDFLWAIPAYFLGSIPTAVWLGRAKYDLDVREHGSKNAGATNTFRVLGKKAGRVVLSIDILKGMLAVLLPFFVLPFSFSSPHLTHIQLVASFMAVLGHVFPIFAGFKGGKGVATSLGVIVGLQPLAAGICLIVFLVVFIFTHYVSLGSVSAAVAFCCCLWLFPINTYALPVFGSLLALIVIFAHRKNIRRLLDGTENKMNLFKK